MSMISSSRADRRFGATLVALFAALGCAAPASTPGTTLPTAPTAAPEAPRAARPSAEEARPPRSGGDAAVQPIELSAVAVRRVTRKEAVDAMGERFAAVAREPLAIEVSTRGRLGNLTRSSSPVIVLNGEILAETIPRAPSTLLAYLPDGSELRELNTVEVVWLGDEERTRTRRPLTFRADAVEEPRE